MKNLFLLFCFLGFVDASAASYRNYVGHNIDGDTYTIWLNSDTAFGESADAEIQYTPSGGGTSYTGFVVGTYDDTSLAGANWKIVITLPAGATNIMAQYANTNEFGSRYGYTGFSTMGNLLPVELTNFTAQKTQKQIELSWTTASEINNDRFEIQRSTNGIDWADLATEYSKNADSNTPQFYNYTDISPARGTNYYRLRQVDFDGSASFSAVIQVKMDNVSSVFDVYPNPAVAKQTTIVFEEDIDNALIQLFTIEGKLVRQMATQAYTKQQIQLDLSDIPSGILFVRIGEKVVRLMH